MAGKADHQFNQKPEEVSFARELGCFDATMIGVGGMIGAGVFVLTGIAAGEAGPSALLAFFFNGIVTLFTALSYAELSSAIPESGGGYTYIKKALPPIVGFSMGWVLWFAYVVACALYASGFSAYFVEFAENYFTTPTRLLIDRIGLHGVRSVLTVCIGALFVWINMRGVLFTGKAENILVMGKIIVLGFFILFGLLQIFETPVQTLDNFRPLFPKGMAGMFTAMGLTFIAFQGYDLISTVSEEVIEPEKNIPRAMLIALLISTVIYLLIVLVSIGAIYPQGITSWEYLGKYKETAIVRAAEQFMPRFGVFTILFGGLLSTISALNATILAGSRVAFSLGRDQWLPRKVSQIHPTFRTPHVAVFATGVLLLVMGIFFPIEVVGSAASTLFLLVFAMVNLSVIVLRRKAVEIQRRYSVPFYPYTPMAGLLCSLALAVYQYRFDPRTWAIGAGWILASILIYYVFFEKRPVQGKPIQLESTIPEFVRQRFSVMIPISNPENIPHLIDLAVPLARAHQGEIIAAVIVSVPLPLPLTDGVRYVNQKRPLLNKASEYARSKGADLRIVIKIAHDVAEGIIDAAKKENVNLLLIGWKGYTTSREMIMGEITDHLLKYAPCDLMVAKFEGIRDIRRILLPTAGGPHGFKAAEITSILAREFNAGVHAIAVAPEDKDPDIREKYRAVLTHTADALGLGPEKTSTSLVYGKSIPAALVKASTDYDLVVIGASREGFLTYLFQGTIPEKLARRSKVPVVIVKKFEGTIKSWMKHFLG